MKLKKGDKVWVKLPVNAEIIRTNKQKGYTLKTDDGTEWSYFGDEDVEKVSEQPGS